MALPTRNTAVVGSAQTIRPSATALFSVNSADRFRSYAEERTGVSSPYDFVIRKGENLLTGFFSRIGLTEVRFPLMLPNVAGSTTKIRVVYNTGGGNITTFLDIPVAFYTPSDIAAYIQGELQAIPGLGLTTFTYGQSPTANLPVFSYATNNASTLAFRPMVENATPGAGYFPFDDSWIQLFDMLGFDDVNQLLTLGSYGHNTLFQKYIAFDIVSTILTGNQALKDATSAQIDRNVVARIYVADDGSQHLPSSDPNFAPAGTTPYVLFRQFNTPKQIAWDGRQPISQLNFQVYDADGHLLGSDLTPQELRVLRSEFQLSLLVSEN